MQKSVTAPVLLMSVCVYAGHVYPSVCGLQGDGVWEVPHSANIHQSLHKS